LIKEIPRLRGDTGDLQETMKSPDGHPTSPIFKGISRYDSFDSGFCATCATYAGRAQNAAKSVRSKRLHCTAGEHMQILVDDKTVTEANSTKSVSTESKWLTCVMFSWGSLVARSPCWSVVLWAVVQCHYAARSHSSRPVFSGSDR